MTLNEKNKLHQFALLALLLCLAFGSLFAGGNTASERMGEIKDRLNSQSSFFTPLSTSVIPQLDCDSLETALRTDTDTILIIPSAGLPGDTIDVQFYIKNDSFMAAFSYLYIFDTALLEPILFPDTIVDCSGFTCDTTIDYYIWTWQTSRAISGGIAATGKYIFEQPNVARIYALPVVVEIDSVAPGGDILCGSRFRVKETAQPGCIGGFHFQSFPIWGIDTTVIPWDSTFFGCLLNESAAIWEDFPVQIVPQAIDGHFKVGFDTTYACGDADSNGSFNIGDATFLITTIFASGPSPCLAGGLGDVNCDGKLSIADVTHVIAAIFASGPAPCCPEF